MKDGGWLYTVTGQIGWLVGWVCCGGVGVIHVRANGYEERILRSGYHTESTETPYCSRWLGRKSKRSYSERLTLIDTHTLMYRQIGSTTGNTGHLLLKICTGIQRVRYIIMLIHKYT